MHVAAVRYHSDGYMLDIHTHALSTPTIHTGMHYGHINICAKSWKQSSSCFSLTHEHTHTHITYSALSTKLHTTESIIYITPCTCTLMRLSDDEGGRCPRDSHKFLVWVRSPASCISKYCFIRTFSGWIHNYACTII